VGIFIYQVPLCLLLYAWKLQISLFSPGSVKEFSQNGLQALA
jgi:hypothetical protein